MKYLDEEKTEKRKISSWTRVEAHYTGAQL
jgi:hypothetical protein